MKLTKTLAAVAVALPLIFAGCASTGSGSNSAEAGSLVNREIQPSQHVQIPDTSSTVTPNPQAFDASLSAHDFTIKMGNGINLGNTMEATRNGNQGTNEPTSFYETLWGQPTTTKAMIEGYKKAGFDTIRIPVAWTNAMDFEDGDYTIKTAYLDRVETIVKWALDADMIVILNDHWDHAWWGMYGSARKEIRESARELYKALWTQVGVRFRNYSEKLIFEGGNEEHGFGFNDPRSVADSGTLSPDELYATANEVNQAFVDIIRAQGGNNANRYLLIPGYETNIDYTCDDRFKMPNDTAKEKLFISVHFYDPSPFCLGGGDLWGSQKDLGTANGTLEKMTKFYDKGYGVIIGEYGALPNEGDFKSATILWTQNTLDNCDLYNYCPVLWDIGAGCFYDKTNCKLFNDELAALYQEYKYDNQKGTPYAVIQGDAEDRIADRLAAAPKILSENPLVGRTDCGIAYLMYADRNWTVNYCQGDDYNPDGKTKGLVCKDVEINGPGTYTVSIDFTGIKRGSAYSTAFTALGIDNGEALFPGYIITIDDIKINGASIDFKKNYFTTSDDGDCTRVNLFNEWVPASGIKNIKAARKADGNLADATACPLNRDSSVLSKIEKYEVTFTYGPAK